MFKVQKKFNCFFIQTSLAQEDIAPSTKLSVCSTVICSTLTEDIVAFSGE